MQQAHSVQAASVFPLPQIPFDPNGHRLELGSTPQFAQCELVCSGCGATSVATAEQVERLATALAAGSFVCTTCNE